MAFVKAEMKEDLPWGEKSDYGLQESNWFREAIEKIVNDLKGAAPVRTGLLRRSIRSYKHRGKLEAEIDFGAEYTLKVNEKKRYVSGKTYPYHHFIDRTLMKRVPERMEGSIEKEI